MRLHHVLTHMIELCKYFYIGFTVQHINGSTVMILEMKISKAIIYVIIKLILIKL